MPGYIRTVLAVAVLAALVLLIADLAWRRLRRPATPAILTGAILASATLALIAAPHAAQADLGPEAARIQLLLVLVAVIGGGSSSLFETRPTALDVAGRPKLTRPAPGRFEPLVALALGALTVAPVAWPAAAALAQEAYLKDSMLPWTAGLAALALVPLAAWAVTASARTDRAAPFALPAPAVAVWAAATVLASPTLLARLDAVISRILHDSVHTLIVLLVIPDHPLLTAGFWNALGILFARDTGLFITLVVVGTLTLLPAARVLLRPLPALTRVSSPVERRRRRALVRGVRRRQSVLSFGAAGLFVIAGGLAWASGNVAYDPAPVPLAVEGGALRIPLSALGGGRFAKYAVQHRGTAFRIIAVRRPDGRSVAMLDACLVCAPQGYAQLGQDLFCKYCGTPIPIMTAGRPGGCNPVPLEGGAEGESLVVDADAARDVWIESTAGK